MDTDMLDTSCSRIQEATMKDARAFKINLCMEMTCIHVHLHIHRYMFDYLKVVPSLLAEDWAESDPSKAAPNCFAPPQGMQCAALDDDDGAGGGAQDRNRKKKGPFATKPKV